MARSHGVIKNAIWTDRDFRALTKDAQRAYLMLLSQPQINNCGVLPYVPKRWARLAGDESEHELDDAIVQLEHRRFVIVDRDTDEALIRTFIKHDRIEAQPNLVKAAVREYGEVESDRIRRALQTEYPHLFGEPLPEPLFEGVPKPLPSEPLPKPLPEGVNARTRVRSRAHTRTAPTPTPTPTPVNTTGSETIARDQPERLPIAKELQVAKLLAWIGQHADPGTAGVVVSLAQHLPEGALAKVAESSATATPDNRAGWTVAALQDEFITREGSA